MCVYGSRRQSRQCLTSSWPLGVAPKGCQAALRQGRPHGPERGARHVPFCAQRRQAEMGWDPAARQMGATAARQMGATAARSMGSTAAGA
eukprot:89950-Chlamydomonas_euryale.AAC.1